MDAIEKRARELLAAEYEKGQFRAYAPEIRSGAGTAFDEEIRAIVAIIAALTPPEGYVTERSVLVAATRIRKLASAATPMARTAYIKAAEMVEMAVIASRPNAPDSTSVTVVSKREAEDLSRRRVARMKGAE
ncbi:hypothetical protein [Stenotrophomonas maltophilia]|uniref:hypothetical protein n=1 Tax=Stenotrophomonas maltophilia TaxID=40324 RepID=UPI0012B0848F|nr:hypothetical protein [Stenotrophomonas maltophilia]QGM07093.1 hypothetical protein FEO88_20550 [Stenotrophomonas maltophilia]